MLEDRMKLRSEYNRLAKEVSELKIRRSETQAYIEESGSASQTITENTMEIKRMVSDDGDQIEELLSRIVTAGGRMSAIVAAREKTLTQEIDAKEKQIAEIEQKLKEG